MSSTQYDRDNAIIMYIHIYISAPLPIQHQLYTCRYTECVVRIEKVHIHMYIIILYTCENTFLKDYIGQNASVYKEMENGHERMQTR